jgi:hypothetical protein
VNTYERDVEWSDLAHIVVGLILTNFPRAKREEAAEELAAWASEAWLLLPEHTRASLRNADLAAGRQGIPEEHWEVLTVAFTRAAYKNWCAAQPAAVRAELAGEVDGFTTSQSRALARLRIGQPSLRDQERLRHWFVKSRESIDPRPEAEDPGAAVAGEQPGDRATEHERGIRVDETILTEDERGFVADEKILYTDGGVAERIRIAAGPRGISGADESNIRAAALVYEAWLLEQAGLFAAADVITQRFVLGTIEVATHGGTGERLASFSWDAEDRLSGNDRALLYARLFGAPLPLASGVQPNSAFDRLFRSLLAALPGGDPALVAEAFQALAVNVSRAGGGYIPFAAERLVDHVAAARAIVADRNVRAALKARGELAVIEAVTSLDLQTVALLRAKAAAGRRILERVADYAAGAAEPVDSALWNDGIRWLAAPVASRPTQAIPRFRSAVPSVRTVLGSRFPTGQFR